MMEGQIDVTAQPDRIEVKPGQEGAVSLTVRNRSDEMRQYWLRVTGLAAEWWRLEPDQVGAFPQESVRATLTLCPPLNTPGPATYHATVWVVSHENEDMVAQAMVDLEVPAQETPHAVVQPTQEPEPAPQPMAPLGADRIQLFAAQIEDAALPPPAAQWQLTIRNAGSRLDTFSFSIEGVEPQWVQVEPAELTLDTGEQGTATLSIQPDQTTAASYPFRVRAFSHINVLERTEIELLLAVQPTAGFGMDIYPADAESQGEREFTVTLTSAENANTDVWIDLSASDQDNACEYQLQPAAINLLARQSATCALRVKPRDVLPPNERKIHRFSVVATPRTHIPPQAIEARLTQVGARPLNLALRPEVRTAELQAEYTLIATNPSGVETTLWLSGQDPEGTCAFTFQPPQLELPPASQAQATVTVRAHEHLEADEEKTIAFTVWVKSPGDLVPTAKAEGVLLQNPVKPVTLELIPQQQSSASSATYSIRCVNPRSYAVQVLLGAADEADALHYAFSPNQIHLSAGAEGHVKMDVRPKDKLLPGEQRRVHRFTVVGRLADSSKPTNVSGTFAQVRGKESLAQAGKKLNQSVKGFGRFFQSLVQFLAWLVKWVVALAVIILLVQALFVGVELLGENTGKDLLSAVPRRVMQFFRQDLPVSYRILRGIAEAIIVLLRTPSE